MDLLTTSLIYNVILAGVVTLCVYWFFRRVGWPRFLAGAALVIIFSLLIAVLLARSDLLLACRLLAYGWFGQLSVYLLAVGVGCRGWRPAISRVAVISLALLIAVVIDCFLIEPFWLEVTRVEVRGTKLRQPLRVAVLADFQSDTFGDYQRDSLRQLMASRPDVIVMAGDYLQSRTLAGWEQLRDEMNAFLKDLDFRAPLGIYAVGGNSDWQRWPAIFEGLPVTIFERTGTVRREQFVVTGLSVKDSFATDITVAGQDKFHIVLGHAPNFALGDVDADLLAAGHTHGGQVRLPGIGPLMTLSEVPRMWAAGVTRLGGGRILAVSRGVGMERHNAPRLRFLCRPQLLILDIVPTPEH